MKDRWGGHRWKELSPCTSCQKHSGICWWLPWWCPICSIGNQADIWGFWPRARLWHPDCRRRWSGWRPENNFPRVSDSFNLDLCIFTFLFRHLIPTICSRKRFFSPHIPHISHKIQCIVYCIYRPKDIRPYFTAFICCLHPHLMQRYMKNRTDAT